MKKPIFLSCCLLAATLTFAQTYQPMALENAHWIVYAIGENQTDHHVFSTQGDTTINGLTYKKTWWQKIQSDATSSAEFVPPFFTENSVLIGAMRDDTLGKQVYYIPFAPLHTENDTCDLFEEWLIYDFSINQGDTIWGCLQYEPDYPFIALSITTEYLWDENRKVIDCDGSAKLVEGVGTGMGPFWPIYAWPHPAKPSFLYAYCVGEDDYCSLLPVAARERLSDWQIVLSPNPVTDQFTVQLPERLHDKFSLTVSDISGKMIFEKNAEGGLSSLQLPVSDLPAGLYLLTIRSESAAAVRKFAKL
ncbi:MAG: T9SS type A sorting domain-containing protein [Bacteroidetes bacterium]|nr:T9SS type A sorting domain-containing protein [Bacteroidota bacterium]